MSPINPINAKAKIIARDISIQANSCYLDQSSFFWWSGSNSNFQLPYNITTASNPSACAVQKQYAKFVGPGRSSAQSTGVLDASSYAWIWGDNTYGQLGTNTIRNFYAPQSVVGAKQWSTLNGGTLFYCGLDSASYAWAWGYNIYGQVGDNNILDRSSPVSVVGGKQWIKIISYGYSTCALDSNSYAWAWGRNEYGQIGDNTITNRSSPVSVLGGKQWANIQLGGTSTFILATDSSSYMWVWGDNQKGYYGNNTFGNSVSSPISVGIDWSKLWACGETIFGQKKDGTLWAWGSNSLGQFGNYFSSSSAAIPILTKFPFTIAKIVGTQQKIMALDTSSVVWHWGYTEMAVGVFNKYPVKAQMCAANYTPYNPLPFIRLVHCGTSRTTTYALDSSSYAWCWGNSFDTTSNGGNRSPYSFPTNKRWNDLHVAGRDGWYIAVALDGSSYAWTWGTSYNNYGQLGNNTLAGASFVPESVVGGKQWLKVLSASYQVYAIDNNSYLWAWGRNEYGQLGNNTATTSSSPISVIGGRQVRQMVATQYGSTTCCFLDSSSYAWTFGYSGYGTLGDNTIIGRSSPVSVVGSKQWRSLGIAGNYTILALDSNSYLWAWGYNGSGQIGDNTISNRSSPVSVVGGKQWSVIPITSINQSGVALDSSSYAWTWGYNGQGQLGINTITNRSSPVSVIGGRQFIAIPGITDRTLMLTMNTSQFVVCGTPFASTCDLGDYSDIPISSPIVVNYTQQTFLNNAVVGNGSWKNILGK